MLRTRALSHKHQVGAVASTYLSLTLTATPPFRSSQRGGTIRVKAASSFVMTRNKSLARVTEAMSSKLDDFFGLSEYDWTPVSREDAPSMYLYELVNWLTTVVDSLALKDAYKEEAYRGAVSYIASCFLVGSSSQLATPTLRLTRRRDRRTSSRGATSP